MMRLKIFSFGEGVVLLNQLVIYFLVVHCFYLFVAEVIAVTSHLFTIIRKFVPESVGCNHESRYIEMVGLARLELAGLFVRSEVQ